MSGRLNRGEDGRTDGGPTVVRDDGGPTPPRRARSRDATRRSTREIGDLFGRAFAKNLANLSVQEGWQGPLRSAFGWHAVQLINREQATPLGFEQVRDKVVIDWKQQQRKKANDAYLENLLATYSIQLPAGVQRTDQP
mgnify:CR=1 FL=1